MFSIYAALNFWSNVCVYVYNILYIHFTITVEQVVIIFHFLMMGSHIPFHPCNTN